MCVLTFTWAVVFQFLTLPLWIKTLEDFGHDMNWDSIWNLDFGLVIKLGDQIWAVEKMFS